MPFKMTTATQKLAKLKKRIHLVPGGTSAGKTISILQILIEKSQLDKTPKLTSIVSESFPHLRKGAMRDFKNIMQQHNYWKDNAWNATESIYTFESGSKIEFFSADQPGKVRGPRRNRLFVNEANNVARESWEQLLLRTDEEAWADWNPVTDFYMYEDYGVHDDSPIPYSDDPRVDVVILTYEDNEGLNPTIIEEIQIKAKQNKQWGQVYAKGIRGEVEGKIYKDWSIIDEIPHEARLERYGLDFGYSNDPSAIIAIYYYNGGYILDEITYQTGMSNRRLADVIKNLPIATVVADSAEPKSIDEIKEYGISVLPANKGQGSVNQGISYLQDQKISMTKRSLNLIKEYRNYLWKTDKDGNIMTIPDGGYDHALDATRYAMETLRPRQDIKIPQYKPQNFMIN